MCDRSEMSTYLVTLVLLVFSGIVAKAQFQPPVYETNDGTVEGQVQYTLFNRKPYYAFKGVPYALPPIGSLRFKVIYNSESELGADI